MQADDCGYAQRFCNRIQLKTVQIRKQDTRQGNRIHNRAVDDAGCTAEIFVKFIEMLRERGMSTLIAGGKNDRMISRHLLYILHR